MYDLCNRLYVDTLIQPSRQASEGKALVEMVRRSPINDKVILIADRAYESYNNFAHIEEKAWKYLIRVKDLGSNGILSGLQLPSGGEFDVCVRRILTRKQHKEIKSRPDIFRFMPSNVTFDFLPLRSDDFYHIAFRVVRFKITDDSYETVITNLEQSEFLPEELRELYHMRWGIETSFRELKYAVGLISFHSKKRAHIAQEVFARIILYNFTEISTSHVIISQADRKHAYQVNFTIATHICRHFLRLWSYVLPHDIETLISKNIQPVRPGRMNKRKFRTKAVVSFMYRVA